MAGGKETGAPHALIMEAEMEVSALSTHSAAALFKEGFFPDLQSSLRW